MPGGRAMIEAWIPVPKWSNPLNARGKARSGWEASREAKAMRTRTFAAIWPEVVHRRLGPAAEPKRVTFTLHVRHRFDDDALPAMCKSVRDELVHLGILSGDSPTHGHEFRYLQVIGLRPGVRVLVEISNLGQPAPPGRTMTGDAVVRPVSDVGRPPGLVQETDA